jgi:hypothetical protein
MNDMIIRLLKMGYSMNEAEIIAYLADNVLQEERSKLINKIINKILNVGFVILTIAWVILLWVIGRSDDQREKQH